MMHDPNHCMPEFALLTPPAPRTSKSCIKIKINGKFLFSILCGVSKGFMKTLNAFVKPFEAPQKKRENKNLS